MRYITVDAEVCTTDALIQLDADELISELRSRYKTIVLIKELLGLNQLSSIEDIIEEIKKLKL